MLRAPSQDVAAEPVLPIIPEEAPRVPVDELSDSDCDSNDDSDANEGIVCADAEIAGDVWCIALIGCVCFDAEGVDSPSGPRERVPIQELTESRLDKVCPSVLLSHPPL